MEYNQQLFSLLVDKFRAGENKAKIVESLTKEGWPEEEVEKTILQIRKAALRRMPLISPVLKFFDTLEENHGDLSTKAQIGLIAALLALVVFMAVAMYFLFEYRETDTTPVVQRAEEIQIEGEVSQ